MGGTFNPVHFGHLRSAVELVDELSLECVHLMPCAVPPHREAPTCRAEDRAAMVALAVQHVPQLICDRRELYREGPSYTVDSLAELRGEYGARRPLCLVIGDDAFLGLQSWHRWESLLEFAHLVVIGRPGWELPRGGDLMHWLEQHRARGVEALQAAPAGSVLVKSLRQLDIASTDIRQLLAAGRSARFLLPGPVLDYIEENQLYAAREETA